MRTITIAIIVTIATITLITNIGLMTNQAIAVGTIHNHHGTHVGLNGHHHHFDFSNVFNDFNNRNNAACFQYPYILSPHECFLDYKHLPI